MHAENRQLNLSEATTCPIRVSGVAQISRTAQSACLTSFPQAAYWESHSHVQQPARIGSVVAESHDLATATAVRNCLNAAWRGRFWKSFGRRPCEAWRGLL